MRAWKRLRTSSEGDADVMLCLEYVDEVSARDIARELVGTEDLNDEDDSDIWAHRVNGARYARVRGRRTMSLGGTVHEKMTVARDDFPRSVRRTMEAVSRDATRALGDAKRARGDARDGENETATRPLTLNHALVNVYERTDGIMAHEDGPLYRDCAAILSLGASRAMTFAPKRRAADDTDARASTTAPESSSSSSFEVFLPHRSLLVFTGEAYRAYVHGIARDVDVDVKSLGGAASLNPEDWPENADTAPRIGRRISLTMRQVVNLTRSLSFLTGR